MKRFISASLLVCALAQLSLFSDVTGGATYVGGTAPIKEKTEGKTSAAGEAVFTFTYSKSTVFSIPYKQINSLEYGQKAGRRVGLAIAISPLFLFSHKRRHFLTIGYLDENNKQQAAVFELGKGSIHQTLTALEAKTGKK